MFEDWWLSMVLHETDEVEELMETLEAYNRLYAVASRSRLVAKITVGYPEFRFFEDAQTKRIHWLNYADEIRLSIGAFASVEALHAAFAA
jgi:hypothetical protein